MKNPTLTSNPRVWRAVNLVSSNLAAVAIVLISAPRAVLADAPSIVSSVVTARTDCSRSWLVTTRSTDPATGQIKEQQHAFTELANGLHYWQDGQWMESQDLIELTAAGAAATKGPNKVTFSPGTGADYPVTIDMVSPSGARLRSKVMGLFYFDAKSGQRVALATLQDSTGVLYAPNVILYPDCLAGLSAGGGVNANANASLASLVYTYCKGGFSQDVLLSSPLPPPESYGLDPATTRLQVVTTFYGPPTPTIRRITLVKADPIQAMGMVSPDLTDDFLVFGNGELFFPVGQAVLWDNHLLPADGAPAQVRPAHPSDPGVILVGKEWIDLRNGTCQLVESIPFGSLTGKLKAAQTAGLRQDFPKSGAATANSRQPTGAHGVRAIRLAESSAKFSGLLLDYVLLSGSAYGYTFTNGTTYAIAASSSFSVGPRPYTANFQSNACIKLGTNASLTCYGAVSFPSTGPASVVFTSLDDDVYGEKIYATNGVNASTGVPNPTGNPALSLYYPSAGQTVQNARFPWAKTGLEIAEGSGGTTLSFYVTSCKFENCPSGIGIWDNLPNGSLYLSRSTYCNVSNALYVQYGQGSSVYGSLTASADVSDASQYGGYSEQETTVAINPLNRSTIAAFSMLTDNVYGTNYGLLRCLTTDAGVTWTQSVVATGQAGDVPLGSADEQAAFDDDGNFFLSYIGTIYPHYTNIVLAVSTNGGGSLSYCTNFHSSDELDKPVLAVGSGCVWLAWFDLAAVPTFYVTGAAVTNHQVGTFLSPTAIQANGNYQNGLPNLAVGPNGQVVFNFVELHTYSQNGTNYNYSLIQVYTNLGGLQNPSWQFSQALSNNFGRLDIPAETNRIPVQNALLAYNRSTNSAAHPGRLYLVYTDMTSGAANDTDIYIRFSDDNSLNWSTPPTRLNTDSSQKSQFFPALSVDPVSGCVGVAWLDCRNDAGNTNAQPFGVISADGGSTWTPNLQLSPGKSYLDGMSTAGAGFGYGDYTWIDFRNRVLHFVWADSSNYSNKNPDGKSATDMSSIRFCY